MTGGGEPDSAVLRSSLNRRIRDGQLLSAAMLGVPGAGKTSFSTELCSRLGPWSVRVNGDSAKARLWGTLDNSYRGGPELAEMRHQQAYAGIHRRAESALRRGCHLVRDYRHDSPAEQNRASRLAAAHGAYHVIAWIIVPVDAALERTQSRLTHDPVNCPGWGQDEASRIITAADRRLVLPAEGTYVTLNGLQPVSDLVDAFLDAIGLRDAAGTADTASTGTIR